MTKVVVFLLAGRVAYPLYFKLIKFMGGWRMLLFK